MRTLAAALAAISLQCAAAPFAVQVGETRIGLDAPPGFADTGFTGSPRLMELAEALTPASNKILLFAISDADLRRFTLGDTPELRRYMIAVTPKGLERERVSPAAFGAFVRDSLAALGSPPAAGDLQKYLDSQPPGKTSLLAELRRDPDVVSVLQGTRAPAQRRSSEAPQYALSTTTLMLLRGKALNLSVYTLYENAADLDWVRATTARWVDEIARLNHR
ncbi:MAG: hypothetical protein E6H44_05160 [Betaproteobacteria bacterium]|nr:MAG: hypothetical protein E6H44_05160 [Betaproteobacteria bacterium]TMI00136.1 MAG: hypothetical protein E6H43_12420 [Betaproteobacteria bacterium]TMI12049.1 MAG: hypothetical protein E6H40_03180 [Betaproteobacteria bacterium]